MTDTTIQPLLTIDTIAKHLKAKDVQFNEVEHPEDGSRLIQMGWRFDFGDAEVIIHISNALKVVSRLEITCITTNAYPTNHTVKIEDGSEISLLEFVNLANRSRAFSRSTSQDGRYFLEYIGFYPVFSQMPQDVFDTIFGGVLSHFQEDFAVIQGEQTIQANTEVPKADA